MVQAMNRITVALVGWPEGKQRPYVHGPSFEETSFDFLDAKDMDLDSRMHVIVTVGAKNANLLSKQPPDMRRRWLHYDEGVDPNRVGVDIVTTFLRNACDPEGDFQFPDKPLVSVVTPTHGHGANLARCLESLKRQSYQNWEWVIYCNGGNLDEQENAVPAAVWNWGNLNPEKLTSIFDPDVPPSVGAVKRRAFGVARGQLLLEFDHDDELTPNALDDLVKASLDHPECGFFYSDCAEVIDGTYEPIVYGEGWGKGYGSYREEWLPVFRGTNQWGGEEQVDQRLTNVTNYPPINLTTLSHIVGTPNHFRAWRRSAYHAAGGHSPELFVADDYELILRTFLTTRMCHIEKLGYIQHERRGGAENTQDARRKEIQRLVRNIWHLHYEDRVEAHVANVLMEDAWLRPAVDDIEHLEVRWPGGIDEQLAVDAAREAHPSSVSPRWLSAVD